jgi:hypothetical protein
MISRIPLAQLPMARELLKLAELPEPPPDSGEAPQDTSRQPVPEKSREEIKHPVLHALKSVAAPAAAFGLGTAGGYLGQLGVERALNLSPQNAPKWQRVAGPLLTGAFGLAMQQYKSRESKELNRAVEAHNRQSERR